MYDNNTLLIVGQAKPSREDAIYTLHIECNTILAVTRNFVADLFIGKSIKTDLEELEKTIKERYFALTQKPLIACMKDAHNRYMMVTGK